MKQIRQEPDGLRQWIANQYAFARKMHSWTSDFGPHWVSLWLDLWPFNLKI